MAIEVVVLGTDRQVPAQARLADVGQGVTAELTIVASGVIEPDGQLKQGVTENIQMRPCPIGSDHVLVSGEEMRCEITELTSDSRHETPDPLD